ncbi:myotubularin-related protein 9 [Eurytemora carolleeae]|uniref:myotubularin-related protein 9 n=1 Tax=Eurytemora carolleeae TaxID=1294199 RepID=UPI000C788ACC|nr:myotubularin-related protein 9 [Eurytemora carolleeae]|eukprot:XP_023333953.1 myotubularin-related protein 9-like [Eurytemora affinis]
MIWSLWCGTKYIVLFRSGCEICEMMWSVWCGTRYIVLNRLGCEMMWRGECVVLVEDEGRGTSILMASIVEILLEEEHRTRQGFEILVQQNWVSLGFPFSTNHQLCSPRAQNSIVPVPKFSIFLNSAPVLE